MKAISVPVTSHGQNATCGHDQIDLVTGEGCPPEQLVVGHSDGTTDFEYQKSLAERGAFIASGFIGNARKKSSRVNAALRDSEVHALASGGAA